MAEGGIRVMAGGLVREGLGRGVRFAVEVLVEAVAHP